MKRYIERLINMRDKIDKCSRSRSSYVRYLPSSCCSIPINFQLPMRRVRTRCNWFVARDRNMTNRLVSGLFCAIIITLTSVAPPSRRKYYVLRDAIRGEDDVPPCEVDYYVLDRSVM